MDRLLVAGAATAYLIAFAWTLYAFGARLRLPHQLHLGLLATGFLTQTFFLWHRGEQIGRCPLTNLYEVLVFLSWSMVLIYLLIGKAYRLSLMGAFTAPLAFLLQSLAIAVVGDTGPISKGKANPWVEMHAALSVVAYGAFALAAVAGLMYSLQQHQLKTRRLATFFFELPPIRDLATVNTRLLALGIILLTGGLLAGFYAGALPGAWKLAGAFFVWLLYAGLLAAHQFLKIGPSRVALSSILAFAVSLAALIGITLMSYPIRRG